MTREAPSSHRPPALAPAQAVLGRIRSIREAQGLSVAALARRLRDLGLPITDNRLWNLESGRTRLHVDTMFGIATALNVSPLTLMTVPSDSEDEIKPAPGVTVSASRFNAWMSGTSPLPGGDEATYAEHHPYGAPITRFSGDVDERARALAVLLASHVDEASAAADALREEVNVYVMSLLEGDPSEDLLRTAEALSRRLGIDPSSMDSIRRPSD